MKVLFKSRDPKAVELREWATERASFAFRRHPEAAPRATIQLSDINGPRGGVDKLCVVEVSAAGSAPVVVRSVAHNWHCALNSALARASTALKKLLGRDKDARTGKRRARQLRSSRAASSVVGNAPDQQLQGLPMDAGEYGQRHQRIANESPGQPQV